MTESLAQQTNVAIDTPWMTPDQAAEYLALPSRKALYEAVRRGVVPCHRLGRRMRFRREDLDAAMRQRKDFTASDVELTCVT